MNRTDRKKFNEELEYRREYIIKCVKIAQDSFEVYKNKPNLANYLVFKSRVKEFYEDGSYTYYERMVAYDQSISMLKTFKTRFPRQYKIIVETLLSEGIEYGDMVNFKDKDLESLIAQQEERQDLIYKLKKNFQEHNGDKFSSLDFSKIFSDIDRHIGTLEKSESQDVNHQFVEVDFYTLFDESIKNAQKDAKKEADNKAGSSVKTADENEG